ncbi:MAG: xylanase [Lachnospiraceae bacterium]|jgi:oligosaccharide reducing-end xylanase|nr:xylanase [Lachnospiraceae bacterium]
MRNTLNDYGYENNLVAEKCAAAWRHIFSDEKTKFYHDVGDTAFMMDTGNTDARSEGMSYGMMMAVQMNEQEIFDKIWLWSLRNMYQESGQYSGYFAWSCAPDGTKNYDGPAPDGEEYFALALYFAATRWGDREAPFDYTKKASDIIQAMIHKGQTPNSGEPMFNNENHLILFVPGSPFSDPSYHLPHFYELIAERCYPEDRNFMLTAAKASREYIKASCHPETGLVSDYADFEGNPTTPSWGRPVSRTHYSDSYRVALNIALDTLWTGGDPEWAKIAERLQTFFLSRPDAMNDTVVNRDGTPYPEEIMHPLGLLATAAAVSAARPAINPDSTELISRFMAAPLRTDERRYYDNCLYFFSLLVLSGQYQKW